jgi:hypothetical protein
MPIKNLLSPLFHLKSNKEDNYRMCGSASYLPEDRDKSSNLKKAMDTKLLWSIFSVMKFSVEK